MNPKERTKIREAALQETPTPVITNLKLLEMKTMPTSPLKMAVKVARLHARVPSKSRVVRTTDFHCLSNRMQS